MKICLVTPDIIGPIRNGGIGTHAYNLCKLLKDYDLTLLYTSDVEKGAPQDWQRLYKNDGIRVLTHETLSNRDPFRKIARWEDWFFERSRRIAEFLNEEQFDLVHFQDWHANGFQAIRLRRTGVALQNTRMVVTMHSPNAWSREGMRDWPTHALTESKLDYAESYCCAHADTLIAPSQHMFDWATQRGWKLPKDHRVYPCAYETAKNNPPKPEFNRQHIIFFGRLETRKGLGIFLEGMKRHLTQCQSDEPVRKITFLGKPGKHNGRRAEILLDEFEASCGDVKIERQLNLDTHQALAYMEKTGGVVFIPSLLDNCPFTVIECIERKLCFRAASTGGIPEMANPQWLFEPTPAGISMALAGLKDAGITIEHRYSAPKANRLWQELHKERPQLSLDDGVRPKVSICVPYYNHPVYLPQLLESVQRMDYSKYEVIVCNDGSPSADAVRIFEEMKQLYRSEPWTFLSQENAGVGSARNTAAAHATGDYLVFMDADNLARPEMLETMVRAMRCSGADGLTCYFTAFSKDDPPEGDETADYIYRPLGSILPLGIFDNTFGDANCILPRSVFESVGGFTTERSSSFEDWEFFLHLAYNGYELDVIPKEIFWYRHLEEGFSRTTNHYSNHMRAISRVLKDAPKVQSDLIRDLALPMYYQYLELERNLGREQIASLSQKSTPWHKHIYRWYRRLLRDPKYIRKV